MNNLLNVKTGDISVTGRSHYWGEVYVSLQDKEIEYATLFEDVITQVVMPGQPDFSRIGEKINVYSPMWLSIKTIRLTILWKGSKA